MTRLHFETFEERIVLAGHLTGALASATRQIGKFDFEEEWLFVSSAAVNDGSLWLVVKGDEQDGPSENLQLWTTDGSEEGTRQITTIFTGGDWTIDSGMAFVGERVFFVVDVWEDLGPFFPSLTNAQLWVSDGTATGTKFVAKIGSPYDFSAELHSVGSQVLMEFAAYIAGGGSRGGLWLTDGTAEGTQPLGPTFEHGGTTPTNGVVTLSDRLLFAAGITRPTRHDSYVDPGIYVASTTDERVEPLRTFRSGVHELTVVGDLVFFWANDGTSGYELWRSDGTAEGTQLVRDLNSSHEPACNSCLAGAAPKYLANVNGTLLFTAYSPEYGRELWKSDGTADGTVLVADITPGPISTPFEMFVFGSDINPTLAVGDLFFFVAFDTGGVSHLWRSDGTASGTFSVGSFRRERTEPGGVGFASLRRFTEVNGKLFFSVDDGSDTTQIWMSDGTAAGTQLAVGLEAPAASFDAWPAAMIALGDSLVFVSSEKEEGHGIWSIDLQEGSHTSDINADGRTDFADLLVLSTNFGRKVTDGPLSGDLDDNGVVDFADFLILASEIQPITEVG